MLKKNIYIYIHMINSRHKTKFGNDLWQKILIKFINFDILLMWGMGLGALHIM